MRYLHSVLQGVSKVFLPHVNFALPRYCVLNNGQHVYVFFSPKKKSLFNLKEINYVSISYLQPKIVKFQMFCVFLCVLRVSEIDLNTLYYLLLMCVCNANDVLLCIYIHNVVRI